MTARGGRQLRQALAYAGHGWPVFPVAPGAKIPATSRGFKDATTGESQIRQWWAAESRPEHWHCHWPSRA